MAPNADERAQLAIDQMPGPAAAGNHFETVVEQTADLLARFDALAQAEEQFRTVIEKSADMLSRNDAFGRYTYVSPASRTVYGLEPDELVGRHPFELIHPDDRDRVVAEVLEALKQGAGFEVEHRILRPDGQCSWLHVLVNLQRAPSGEVTGGIGTVRDISAQREAELKLERAEEQFRTVIELSGDMHTRTDASGRFTFVSPNSTQIVGWTPEQVVGRLQREFAHPADLERCDAALAQARATGSAEVEYRVQRPDGSHVWLHALLRARRDQDGEVVEVVRASRDITAQREAEEALARTTEELLAVVELSGDMLSRHDLDGRYLYASPNALHVVGHRPDQLVGRSPYELVHADDRARVRAASRTAFRSGAAEVEYRSIHADGSCGWVHALLRARPDDRGQITDVVVASREITKRKHREARLREITERFAGAFEHAPIGMALVGLDGSWIKVNREMCRISGYSEAQLLAKSFRDITHPDDMVASVAGLKGLQAGQRFEVEKRYLHADGHVIWVHIGVSVVCDEHGQPQHFVSQTQDITERKELQARLAYLADHDTLTQLCNRRRFESELEHQLARSRRYDETAAVLMLDLDHFKYVNDALGHHVGDRVIAHVAEILARRLRSSDVLARLGGDEYAAILPHTNAADARSIASQLVEAIEQNPFTHDENRYELSASAGVVLIDQHTASAEDALVNVDLATHDAKQRGRNRIAVYSPDTRQDILSGLTWSQRLKQALSNDGFTLHAQPIVDLTTGETRMLELLIRMRAGGELVSPGRFLQAAARFGYMPAIDRWVISQAARHAAAVPGRQLAVNLAANTIAEPGLVGFVTQTLAATSANPADLIFEISESDVIANLDDARSVCEQLRELGARIALDDFGSGFSGFAYLKALEIDLLKIDGQFVRQLDANRLDQLVIEAIVHVANGIDVPTVAEYVESELIAQRLRTLGIVHGQGFHLGRPAPLA